MADQIINGELLQQVNARVCELVKCQLELVKVLTVRAGPDCSDYKPILRDLERLHAAPLAKVLDRAEIWRNRLKTALTSYKVPEVDRDEANQIFNRENTEFRNTHGWSQPGDRIIQKGKYGYHLYHPLTGKLDPEPILFPYTPKVDVFYGAQSVQFITGTRQLNLPITMMRVLETSQKMGLGWSSMNLMLRQIVQLEAKDYYDDVKDIQDSVEFVETLTRSLRLNLMRPAASLGMGSSRRPT